MHAAMMTFVMVDHRQEPGFRPAPYVGAFAIVIAALALSVALREFLGIANVALVFLTAVLVTAVAYGLWPSLFAAVVATMAYNFFFLPPLYDFAIADRENVVALIFFGLVAVIAGNLTTRLRNQAVAASQRAESDRLRTALLTSISHDLRTPLASILGAATSLRQYRATLDEKAHEDLAGLIQDEAERLNRFIVNLLDMTRLECGRLAPVTEMIDLSDVIGSALQRARKVLGDRPVRVEMQPDLPMLKLDPVLFEQVLFNLFDNAARYAPPPTELRIAAAQDGKVVRLVIEDAGSGIPKADLERIFDKFYRVEATDRQRAGTGLGLAICRGFVEAMNGTITAGNRDGRGAIFTITLPVPETPAP